MPLTLTDRARGCLLAGAVGDALGGSVEFDHLERIRQRYGPDGIRDLDDRGYGVMGAITDDTQMTLFTAEGLLRAKVRAEEKGICHPPSVVHHAYLRWLLTQGVQPRCEVGRDGWLIEQRELWQCRAPGPTCLNALRDSGHFGQFADNDRKGCGGVMRVAPAAFFVVAPEAGFELGCDLAHYTHGHPTGYLAAGALVALIRCLIDGHDLRAALERVLPHLAGQPDHEEVSDALRRALALADSAAPPNPETVERLGGGWIAEEALAIAVYCALVAPDLEQGLILAVNHSGDSDSTGAIAGNILGTQSGSEAIPTRWLERLELHEVIDRLARDMVEIPQHYGEQNPDELWSRYPGW